MQIDVATTATLRPEMYRRTLDSFAPLFAQHDNWRLILNVDPAGDGKAAEVVELADRFPHSVVHCPAEPDFRVAWRWCVGQLKNKYVLWLEDDWELTRDVNLAEMLQILDQHEDLASLRLPRWDTNPDGTFRQWNKRRLWGWNGSFSAIPRENVSNCGYSNNPCLTRSEFLTPVLPHLYPDLCPEKQLSGHNSVCYRWLGSWEFGVFQRPGELLAVRDIGEQWRKDRKIGKGDKMRFSTWEFPK